MREYSAEIEGLSHYLLRETERGHNSYSLLEAIANSAPGLRSTHDDRETLTEVEKHFSVALALALGLQRIGVERFLWGGPLG